MNQTSARAGIPEPFKRLPCGDLARLSGVGDDVVSAEPRLRISEASGTDIGPKPFMVVHHASGRPGLSLMIIGDSFTGSLFSILALPKAGDVYWVNYMNCTFDWGWIDRVNPAEVWWITTERFMPCDGNRPVLLP
jgi:hypothetical protein